MKCVLCHAENPDSAERCAGCGRTLIVSGGVLAAGSILASRYEILSLLGKGGMGLVYKARDRVLEETVALKVLLSEVAEAPDMEQRFRSEIKLARKVRHRNVCAIHEYGEEGPLRFITMEFIEGQDLKHVLHQRGALPAAEAFDITIQLAEALQAIHDAGVVHRDLKTSNVMLDKHGVVRLMDFGIAKQLGLDATAAAATAVGHILGTPEYMSPEQARGATIDFRSDLYALGVVIYEVFTGHVPFHGNTPIATIFKQLEEPLRIEGPEAELIPPALEPVLRQALAKLPEERQRSAHELADALRQARGRAVPASPPLEPVEEEPATATITRPTPTSTTPPPSLRAVTPPPAPPTVMRTPAPGGTKVMPPTLRGGTPVPHRPEPPPPPPLPRHTVPPPLPARRPPVRPGAVGGAVALAVLLVVGGVVMGVRALLRSGGAGEGLASPVPTPALSAEPATPAGRAVPEPVAEAPLPHVEVGTPPPAVVVPATESPRTAPPATPPPATAPATAAPRTPPPTAPGTPPPPRSAGARQAPELTPLGPAPQSARERTSPPEDVTGMLQLLIKPWAEISIDGARVGTTPLRPLRLSAGTHVVRMTHPDYKPLQRKVTLRAGETTKLVVDLTWEAFPRE